MPSGVSSSGMNIYEVIPRFRQMAAEFGTDPDTFPVTYFNLDPKIEDIKKLEDLGIDRVVFALPSKRRDIILPILDSIGKKLIPSLLQSK